MLFIQTILLCIENCFWCRLLLSQQLFFGIFILISRTVTFVYLLLLPIQSDYNLFIIFNTFIFAHQLKSICFLYFVPYWVVNWLNWIQRILSVCWIYSAFGGVHLYYGNVFDWLMSNSLKENFQFDSLCVGFDWLALCVFEFHSQSFDPIFLGTWFDSFGLDFLFALFLEAFTDFGFYSLFFGNKPPQKTSFVFWDIVGILLWNYGRERERE